MGKNAPNPAFQAEPWSADTYQTGSTTPPKSRNGIIALLLVLVIVLCGVITVLGITNVHLFRLLSIQDEGDAVPVFFSNTRSLGADQASVYIASEGVQLSTPLGIHGEGVPMVHQLYYRLPAGLYVNQVDPYSSAYRQGLLPGDIITHIDGASIASLPELHLLLEGYAPGDILTLTVYRNRNTFPLRVTVEPAR